MGSPYSPSVFRYRAPASVLLKLIAAGLGTLAALQLGLGSFIQ